MYVIRQDQFHAVEFFCGKTYIHQGVKYGIFSTDVREAKVYLSERVAKRALKKHRQGLNNIVSNAEVVPTKQG